MDKILQEDEMKNKDQLIADFISALKKSPLLFEGEELDEKLIKSAMIGNVNEYGLFTIKPEYLNKKDKPLGEYIFCCRFKSFRGVKTVFAEGGNYSHILFIRNYGVNSSFRCNGYLCAIDANVINFINGKFNNFALPMSWIKTRAAQALERHAERLNMDFSRSIAKCVQNKVNDLLCGKDVTVWINEYGVNWQVNGKFITNAEALKIPQSESQIDDLALEIAEAVEASSFL